MITRFSLAWAFLRSVLSAMLWEFSARHLTAFLSDFRRSNNSSQKAEIYTLSSKQPPQKIRFDKDLVAIEASNRPRLTGIVRGTALLHVLRSRPVVWPDSRRRSRECQMRWI
ncbi:hypothetical protein TNCV_444771 [Trichonephila clavipes]|nr:hypothetical protein TNCV_444771 [Trichonephila clavipes]